MTTLQQSKAPVASAAPIIVALVLAIGGAACSGDCCTVDSFPIGLQRAPAGTLGGGSGGGLLAVGRSDSFNGGASFPMSLDTGAALTVFDGSADGVLETMSRSLQILDTSEGAPLRALFRGIDTLTVPIGDVGDASQHPLVILGGDVLRGFSVELQLGKPSITFWDGQRADDGFLADAGYAVLHFTPFGGGEVTAQGNPDLLGLQGPLDVAPTRIVLRACAAPPPFDPALPSADVCCTRNDALTLARGAELSLLLATGVGPVVLGESAWRRVVPALTALGLTPALVPGPLWIATAPRAAGQPGQPISAQWTTIPRIALVNQETNANDDAGPCVDLARARRLERVSFAQAGGVYGPMACMAMDQSLCVQPCDTDPQDTGKAQNSAAYVDLGGDLAVAIVSDDEPLLQGLRGDIRPEGPEIDGIIGAGALQKTRVEIDYRSSNPRAIFSCDTQDGVPPPPPASVRDSCWTGARCPRLPDGSSCHSCFNLGPHTLPHTCMESGCPR